MEINHECVSKSERKCWTLESEFFLCLSNFTQIFEATLL